MNKTPMVATKFYFKSCFEDNVSVMLQEKVNMR